MNREKPRPTRLLLERRMRALKHHLPAAISGDGTGVHQARVASRRLREALPVLAVDLRGSKAKKAERKIRKLTAALGAVRELDVTLQLIDRLAAAGSLPRPALEDVRTHVAEERQRRGATMLEKIEAVPIAKMGRRLASVAEALQDAETERWREALGLRLNKRAKALTAAVARAGQMYSPDSLHLVRIATKKLRYGLEIAAEAGVRAAAPLVRQLKRTQEALGRLHDLQMLEVRVAAVQARPRERANSDDEGLAQVARALASECRHLHGRYIAQAPALLAAIDGTRRVVLASLAGPARARRAPKMALGRKPRSSAPEVKAAAGTTGRR